MTLEAQYIAPLFALLGTLVVAGLGFFQWRKQHANPHRTAIADARRKAVEALWAQLEKQNLALRVLPPPPRDAVKTAKFELNKLFFEHSLYLDDELQQHLNQYVKAMHKVAHVLLDCPQDPAQEDWDLTVFIPNRNDGSDLMQAVKEMNELRDRVRIKLKSYLSA